MSRETLDAEVAAYRARRHNAEPKPAALPMTPRDVLDLSTVMPEVTAKLARVRDHWKNFCDSQREAFDAALLTTDCQEHGTPRRKLFEETCQQTRLRGEFTVVYAPCALCQGEKEKVARQRFWSRRGLPERVMHATLENFDTSGDESVKKTALVADVRAWLKRRGCFLLLLGTQGTGKGHMASACLKAQGDGLFITHADMISDLRASYALQSTREVMERWQDCEMLVLDEFGIRSGGKDEEPMLYQVLADRHDKRRPTIITTNLEAEELRTLLGYRLVDRIREECTTVVCRWKSYRTGK